MPVGVYRKKNKKGNWMYFRSGKLISKKSYDASTSRRTTKKGGVRKTARRAYTKKNRSNRRMKKGIPHPSVTGMASGLTIANYLNTGTTTKGGKPLDGVIKDVADGQLGQAFNTLSSNAINMIASDDGRKTLVTAGGIAVLGAFARKQWPTLKLGGSKLYFRL